MAKRRPGAAFLGVQAKGASSAWSTCGRLEAGLLVGASCLEARREGYGIAGVAWCVLVGAVFIRFLVGVGHRGFLDMVALKVL